MKDNIIFKFCSILYCISVLFNYSTPLTVFALEENAPIDSGTSVENNSNNEVIENKEEEFNSTSSKTKTFSMPQENGIMKVSNLDDVYVSNENKGTGDCSNAENACTINEAINSANEEGTIYITEDITVSTDININKNINIMSLPGIGCTINLTNDSSIVIKDNVEATLGSITIDGFNNTNATKAAVSVENGTLNISNDTTITNNVSSGKAGGIFVGKDGVLNLKYSRIHDNYNIGGSGVTGGIYGTSDSKIKIYPNEGGSIYNNDKYGQDIYVEEGNKDLYISSFVLGGGYSAWKRNANENDIVTGKYEGEEAVILSSFINGADVGNGTVEITNNTTSNAQGAGGIYCEGSLNIGTSDNSAIKINIEADDEAINVSRNHGQFGFYIKLKGEEINSKRVYFQDTGYNVARAATTLQDDGSYLINPIVDIREDKTASFYVLNIPNGIEYEITELNPMLKVSTQVIVGDGITNIDDKTLKGTMTKIENKDNYDNPIQAEDEDGTKIKSKFSIPTNVIANYTNSVATNGRLTVKNEVEGNDNRNFEFVLRLESPTEPNYTPISGEYGGCTFENGEYTFNLKDNESRTFEGLPENAVYTIEEKHTFGYTVDNEKITGTVTTNGETITINNIKSSGSISITNNVDSIVKDSEDLMFTITLLDGTIEGKYVSGITGKYGDIEFENGIATFTLKAGEKKEATNLPSWVGYIVEEAYDDNYTFTSEYSEGIIEPNENIPVIFTNTRNKGDLQVSTKVEGEDNKTKEFNFTITLDDDSVNGEFGDMYFTNGVSSFTLKSGETKTAKGLPAGVKYTVVEEDNKDEYKKVVLGDKGTIKSNEISEAKFINTKSKIIKMIEDIKNNINSNPNTADNIISYVLLLILSTIGLVILFLYKRKIKK